ncbi:unnamed protein product [Arctogadus glacialis]
MGVSPALQRSPHPQLQAALQRSHIQTMAFTPPHTLPWRVYLYTHTRWGGPSPRGPTLVLGELLYTGGAEDQERDGEGGERGLRVTAKQRPRDNEAMKGFLQVLSGALHTSSTGSC